MGREVLDAAHRAVRPGVTTDEIDRVVSLSIRAVGGWLLGVCSRFGTDGWAVAAGGDERTR